MATWQIKDWPCGRCADGGSGLPWRKRSGAILLPVIRARLSSLPAAPIFPSHPARPSCCRPFAGDAHPRSTGDRHYDDPPSATGFSNKDLMPRLTSGSLFPKNRCRTVLGRGKARSAKSAAPAPGWGQSALPARLFRIHSGSGRPVSRIPLQGGFRVTRSRIMSEDARSYAGLYSRYSPSVLP